MRYFDDESNKLYFSLGDCNIREYVSEFVKEMKRLNQATTLHPDFIKTIFSFLCKAVLYLFRQTQPIFPIFHSDIKPINTVLEEEILLDNNEISKIKCKLIDAGNSTQKV